MANIFKHEPTGQILRPGKPWNDPFISKKMEIDENGNEVEVEIEDYIQRSPSWNKWSADYKSSMGIVEIVQENPPDSRLYTWFHNDNGTINKTAKDLDEVKSSLKQNVNTQQSSLLIQTDWMYIRKIDKSIEIPVYIQSWRDSIRVQGDAMKSAIDVVSNIEEIVELFVVYRSNDNGSQTKSGILYDWPELEE
jgi:hypothetical protein